MTTSRDIVLDVIHRRTPERLPRELKLTPALMEEFRRRTGATCPVEHFGLDVDEVHFRAIEHPDDFRPYYPDGLPPLPNPEGWELGQWGVGQEPGSVAHFVRLRHPLENVASVDELSRYPFPDLSRPERHAHLEAEVARLHGRGRYVVGVMEWTVLELGWYLVGMERLLVDLFLDPEPVAYLLDRITEVRCFQARRFAEAGVDMIRIGDDLGMQHALMIAPETYREWFKPRHARVIAAARAVRSDIPVSYHTDGNCWDAIGDLIEIGVTVLNPVQPECLDLKELKREFGRDLCFWGGIGTQTTMPFSSPEEVYRTVQETIDTLGPGGYFPCPTHVLEPDVPWENIEAYLRAVQEWA